MKQHSCVLRQIRKSNRHSAVIRHHITQVKPHGLEQVNIKFMLWLLYSLLSPQSPDWVVPGLGLNSLVKKEKKKILLLLPVTKSKI